jgi:hypothetical protein
LTSPAASPRFAERKNCRSEAEVLPSPQIAAIGKAWCASMMRASAAL